MESGGFKSGLAFEEGRGVLSKNGRARSSFKKLLGRASQSFVVFFRNILFCFI